MLDFLEQEDSILGCDSEGQLDDELDDYGIRRASPQKQAQTQAASSSNATSKQITPQLTKERTSVLYPERDPSTV